MNEAMPTVAVNYSSITTPVRSRVGTLVFVWLTFATGFASTSTRGFLGVLAFLAGLLLLFTALVTSRRFERTYGSALRHPAQHGHFILWLLLGFPFTRATARWELLVGLATLVGVAATLISVAVRG